MSKKELPGLLLASVVLSVAILLLMIGQMQGEVTHVGCLACQTCPTCPACPACPTAIQLPGGLSDGTEVQVKVSWYYPPLGGPNCATFRNGKCISKMASGLKWEDYVDLACACPPEWPFGTVVTIDGKSWTCLDRGGKIKFVGGIPWVDLLQARATYVYGSVVAATVQFPEATR